MEEQFDFIVVGVGSAGSVVASRLSESGRVQVLALEAGSRPKETQLTEKVDTPFRWAEVQQTSIDWQYNSIPQPDLNGRVIREPRGKVPGGSSNLYIMMHIRGHRTDFDSWAYGGCPGWSYADVLPYFGRLENQTDGTNPLAGIGGPLELLNASLSNPNPTSAAFIEACVELGFSRVEDFNGPEMVGTGWHHVNIRNGRRHNMFLAYLQQAIARPNLTLRESAQVVRLNFDEEKRCRGVTYFVDGLEHTATSTREVIVCAGAIESPKLLLLSGVGPGAHISQFGVRSLVDLPGVGENFHNHVLAPVVCGATQKLSSPNLNLSEAALFYRSQPGWPSPDMQMAYVHANPVALDQNAMIMLPGVVRPMSRGWIRLASADPFVHPAINPNYLHASSDLERMIGGVKLARRLFRAQAFSKWFDTEYAPGFEVHTDDELRKWVRSNADSYHHQAGSCKMGLDSLAVVNPQLQVHGTHGLRVADASVMPVVPSGNCHAAVVMIGERAADFIRTEHGL